MLPTPRSYSIYPSVLPADRVTEMTICANEPAFLFREGEELSLRFITVYADENYYAPHTHRHLTVQAEGGVLRFSLAFAGEGEHLIELYREERLIGSFTVYSLYEDLYSLTPLRGDLHSHSCRSDGTRDAAAQAGHYREMGYDFVALTDHNRYYVGEEIDRAYAGVDTGLVRVLGEEVHCPGSVVHIVHVGGRASVAAIYTHEREKYEKQIKEYLENVPAHVPAQYRERYAKAMWATDTIHSFGGLAIFPHPFWRPNASRAFNVCDELTRLFLKSGMFDAYELIGGMEQHENNRSVALWSDLRAEGVSMNVVGSSDVHSLERSPEFPSKFTVCFATEKSNAGIVEAVKSGMSVAVESTGYEYDKEYRAYGSVRLVTYAQFLLRHYFPRLERLTAGAGVAMRAFLMEDADASLVAAHTALADKFTARFFGRLAPKLPSEKLLAFEAQARDAQLKKGPKTRGSSVDATPAKSLI